MDDTIHVHIVYAAQLLNWLLMRERSELRNQTAY
jgi:hypothetical protein